MKIGATYLGNHRCNFTVWAPLLQEVAVQIAAPEPRRIPMQKEGRGYWTIAAENVAPGTLYSYELNGSTIRPDPASYCQPDGVHQPSQVVDVGSFGWTDAEWKSLPLEEYIIYEIHVGTFTPEGTFEAIIDRLDDLKALGISAIELMPVAQFPGDRNWGYDGVYPFAVQQSYGGVRGLQNLVDACHQKGLAVVLDVVYNHLGPEGNYTANFAPYFTRKYSTPWGSAVNFDDADSHGVRNFCIENALYWFREFHIDALRLDAIHAIFDRSPKHFLAELAQKVAEFSEQQGRSFYLIAESDLNDDRVIKPLEGGGYGMDAQWCDDLHHSLHCILTQEERGYYQDFREFGTLVKALKQGFAYTGQYSEFRQRNYGSPATNLAPTQIVVYCQNHDQVGNRMLGERLSALVSFEALKLAAGTILLSAYIPLLFMGEEYGEEAPFLYFISHGDRDLVESVRRGRKLEFEEFYERGKPPDPQGVETFLQSKLDWEKREIGQHQVLLEFYKKVIQIRRESPVFQCRDRQSIDVKSWKTEKAIAVRRQSEKSRVVTLFNFSDRPQTGSFSMSDGNWKKILDSSDIQWKGPGSTLPENLTSSSELTLPPLSFSLYQLNE